MSNVHCGVNDHALSDRDIRVFTSRIPALLSDETWWNALSEVLAVERLQGLDGNPTRLIYHSGGKLDFTPPAGRGVGTMPIPRPYVALVDKDARRRPAARLSSPLGRPYNFSPARIRRSNMFSPRTRWRNGMNATSLPTV